jgi:Zn-dependent M28 family amino/carboxypeptidase
MDMVGLNWPDTIVAIGRGIPTSAPRSRAEAAHSSSDDGARRPWPNERFYCQSDHYHFARRGVPILFFFSGPHPTTTAQHPETDRRGEAGAADADLLSRA